MTPWNNWAGNVQASPDATVQIDSEQHLADTVAESQRPVRVRGAGHSFSPLLEVNSGSHLCLNNLNHVSAEAGAPRSARIGAGVRLHELTPQLNRMGLALDNMGDIDAQALGGALATATHGTGQTLPCYSAMLEEMVLIDGQGQRRRLRRDLDEELFRAMAVGLGTGGILAEVVMSLVPTYRLSKRRFRISLEELLSDFSEQMSAARHVEFFYILHSGHALGLASDLTDQPVTDKPEDTDQKGLLQLRQAARLLGWAPPLRKRVLAAALRSHSSEQFVADWFQAFASDRGRIRFNETEYHLPADAAPDAIRELIDCLERNFPEVYFPIEIRSVRADDLYLSPFYQRDSVSVAVHHEATKPFAPVLAAVEPIFRRYGGRPHWGKSHTLTAGELRSLYPRFDEAVAARRELDPKGLFNSPYIEQLLGL
ncbi:D-arabinono-1,4-lactone oxidase [Marinobacter sp. CHS3-4]|uniref:D-arabinono-1,4-lactone oxidase n=1 Tax=Marinobacter sp. CHS3-4 TaxID=3045174 RepID=UPI0024B5CDFB|nr:D-arabinono-1,4-lactone oxidase [Marinobacter sp. CHS3-4]MDI9244607.1 D-arabinono-1,4-lactone oxidase [Marinobacter sp. CHS3-4]